MKGGALVGAGIGSQANACFEFKDAEQEKTLREFLYGHYGVR
jgi:hypothetical protein